MILEHIDGLRLGDRLSDADVTRLALKQVTPEEPTVIPYWSNELDDFTIYEEDGVIDLISTGRDAPGLGDVRLGAPCEEIALTVRPPDSFEDVTGDWVYLDGPREVRLHFFDGHLVDVAWQLM